MSFLLPLLKARLKENEDWGGKKKKVILNQNHRINSQAYILLAEKQLSEENTAKEVKEVPEVTKKYLSPKMKRTCCLK